MEYYINRAEQSTTPRGKLVKKLELAQEGKQYALKNVTMWGDNPLFAQAIAGATIQCEIQETDSGTPNPNAAGKNYINRTVLNPGQAVRPAQQSNQSQPNVVEMAIKTHISQEIASLRADLRVIADFLNVPAPIPRVGNTQVPYPTDNLAPAFPEDDINPEDIPF